MNPDTTVTTGTSTKAALARAETLLRKESGGSRWSDSDQEICEDRLLLRINETLVTAIRLLTLDGADAPLALGARRSSPRTRVYVSLYQGIAEDFETYWAIGNVEQPETAESRHPLFPDLDFVSGSRT